MVTSKGIEGSWNIPPGPRGWFGPTRRMISDPIAALRDWQARFGPTFTINQLGTRVVVTCDPDLVAEIYAVRDLELFAAVLPPAPAVLFGQTSLLMDAGEAHLRKRRLMTPCFHGERMRAWAETIAAAGRRAFCTEDGVGHQSSTGELRALERTQRATLEVIVRVIFGVDDDARVDEFVSTFGEWTLAVRPGFLFVRALQHDFLGISSFARYRRVSERVDALLFEQIARARAGSPDRGDVLTSLVNARDDQGDALSDATIKDQLRTLLYAGHETTAIVLAWALYFVARDPLVRERVIDELASLGPSARADQIAELPYLGAVIDETLRIRPVTPDVLRVLRKPARFGPWTLPAGTALNAAPTLLHHRADLWPEPEAFRPDRFIGERPGANVYIPFGGGDRRCMGASFARFEATILLGTLLRELEFELLDEQVEWGRALATLQPLGGVRMRVRSKD